MKPSFWTRSNPNCIHICIRVLGYLYVFVQGLRAKWERFWKLQIFFGHVSFESVLGGFVVFSQIEVFHVNFVLCVISFSVLFVEFIATRFLCEEGKTIQTLLSCEFFIFFWKEKKKIVLTSLLIYPMCLRKRDIRGWLFCFLSH